ncbi:MAG TPA: hypothetical protein PK360_22155, partial [bacterium]|nr:hypothetical protein [bacterium]
MYRLVEKASTSVPPRDTTGRARSRSLSMAGFIVMAALLIAGALPGRAAVGGGALASEPLMPGGVSGLAGSLLIVMFSYAGFEVIGLAASEARR